MLRVAQMLGHLGFQRPLQHRFGQLFEQAVLPDDILGSLVVGEQLVDQFYLHPLKLAPVFTGTAMILLSVERVEEFLTIAPPSGLISCRVRHLRFPMCFGTCPGSKIGCQGPAISFPLMQPRKSAHPRRTVVTNNSAADMQPFRYYPLEWLRGWLF